MITTNELIRGTTMNNKVYVWDPLVRIFHWTLVVAFLTAYLTGDEENTLHIYSGYYILGLIAFRLLWGFIGTKYARFSSFNLSPRALFDYLTSLFSSGKGKQYTGHNPAGSWMVMLMLLSLLATGFSGLKTYAEEGYGPLAQNTSPTKAIETVPAIPQTGFIKVSRNDDEDHDYYAEHKEINNPGDAEGEEYWEEIHEFFANFTVLLVFLHILGVILSSNKHGQNLVRTMITGYKHAQHPGK
jgi:cytochrome b